MEKENQIQRREAEKRYMSIWSQSQRHGARSSKVLTATVELQKFSYVSENKPLNNFLTATKTPFSSLSNSLKPVGKRS
jgi:hypothetical protein